MQEKLHLPSNVCFPSVYEEGTFDFCAIFIFCYFLKLNY
jgi:hypothetical protein